MGRFGVVAVVLFSWCVAGAVCAADAPPVPAAFQEAPDLADMVARGELPPVGERLPSDPKVVVPVEEIGTYGGMWRRAHMGPKDVYGMTYLVKETLVVYSRDYQTIVPNLCSAYEISDDERTFTFHLRRGIRWSDGAPFTADDYVFWYNDHLLYREMNPTVPMWFKRGGKAMELEKLDDYTIRIRFAAPFASFIDYLAGMWNPTLYAPAHHCKKYHPRYVPEAELKRMMAEGGYATWQDMYRKKTWYGESIETPTVHAWNVANSASEPLWKWRRNPYYWKVDPAGNQLPYLDGVEMHYLSNAEAIQLAARAGEIDLQMRRIGGINVVGIENYPFLMENCEKGNYRLILRDIFRQNKFAILFNFSHRDPILRGIFNDLRFRIALSHAIDRNEMNEFCMGGLGFPCQVMPNPKSRWFDPEAAKMYIEYDPDKANRLLDEMGLTWDAEHKWRTRQGVKKKTETRTVKKRKTETVDGKDVDTITEEQEEHEVYIPTNERVTLSINMMSRSPSIPAMELVREQLEKVGILLSVTPVVVQYFSTAVRSGNYDLTVNSINTAWDGCFFHVLSAPPYYAMTPATQWGNWVRSGGRIGDKPPDWFLSIIDQSEAILGMPAGPKRVTAIKAMQRDTVKYLLRVGGVASPPEATFAVVHNDMRNVPDPLPVLTCCDPAIFFKRKRP